VATAPHPAAPLVRVVKAVPGPASTSGARYLGEFVITCYDLGGSTASGAGTSLATVAVDPSIIPLGTTINIEGVGTRVAQDTGGAIVGHRLDLWEPSYADCMAWGVQTRAVTIAD
jgi:3D (Asp-Asp-Asp) domain-containing protein